MLYHAVEIAIGILNVLEFASYQYLPSSLVTLLLSPFFFKLPIFLKLYS